MSAAERGGQFFVDVWADDVRRRVREVRATREQYDQMNRAFERGESTLTEQDLKGLGQRLWAAQHHLVWATNQLEHGLKEQTYGDFEAGRSWWVTATLYRMAEALEADIRLVGRQPRPGTPEPRPR